MAVQSAKDYARILDWEHWERGFAFLITMTFLEHKATLAANVLITFATIGHAWMEN